MIFVKEEDGKVTLTYNMWMLHVNTRGERGRGNVPYFLDVQKVVLDVR